MKIYLSSTYEDLEPFAQKVYDALTTTGHDVEWMKHYAAGDQRAVDCCLPAVADADVYVGLFAFRYGFVPPADHRNPEGRSITELEFNTAWHSEFVEVRTFVLHERARENWPDRFKDAATGENGAGTQIDRLRDYLLNEAGARPFSTPEELQVLVQVVVVEIQVKAADKRKRQLSVDDVPPLHLEALFDLHYGHLKGAARFLKRQHVSDLVNQLGQPGKPVPLMGDLRKTARTTIEDQFAVYFEGETHFLKLQTYPLPRGAQAVRVVTISDPSAIDYMEFDQVRVVQESDGEYRTIRPSSIHGVLQWPLAPVVGASRLYVVTAYIEARPLATQHIMDIWIEINDLAGKFTSMTIGFGASLQTATLRNAYQIDDGMFYPFDPTRVTPVDDAFDRAVALFTAVFEHLDAEPSPDAYHDAVLPDLWREFLANGRDRLAAVRLSNVLADLLLVVKV